MSGPRWSDLPEVHRRKALSVLETHVVALESTLAGKKAYFAANPDIEHTAGRARAAQIESEIDALRALHDFAVNARRAIPEDDPVWQAVLRAPVSTEPETEEERRAVEEAKRSGRWVPHEEVMAIVAAKRAVSLMGSALTELRTLLDPADGVDVTRDDVGHAVDRVAEIRAELERLGAVVNVGEEGDDAKR